MTTFRDLFEGHSVTKIARELKVSTSSVYHWINKGSVPPKHAIRLANALDVEIPTILLA